MKVRTTQIIDFWLGVPLCALFSVWHALVAFLSRPQTPGPTEHRKKILFLELSEMGSAIIAHSALAQTKRRYPEADLFFMVFSKNKESVSPLGIIPEENLVLVDASSFGRFAVSTVRALFRLRRLGIDTVIDLELFSRFTAMVSYLSGASTRVGFHNYTAEGLYRGSLLTHKIFYNPHQHMELNFLALVLALSAPLHHTPMLKENVSPFRVPLPRHSPTTHEVGRLWKILKSEQPKVSERDQLLIVNPDPGDALPIRGWPLERYVETVGQLLALNDSLYCVVIGLKASRPYAEALQDALGAERVLDLTGKTKTLRDVVTLFTLADLLITNDSGPAHFAALTDIRSIALFGPGTPALYGALGEGKKNIWENFSCSPCLSAHNHRHTVCKDSLCLKAIGSASIVAEAQTLLLEARKSKPDLVRIAV